MPAFVLPAQYAYASQLSDTSSSPGKSSITTHDASPPPVNQGNVDHNESLVFDTEKGRTSSVTEVADRTPANPFLVDWYGPDDPENPRNWSFAKKAFVTFDIALLSFSVYIGSAIFAPGILDLSIKFGVSITAATLGITMFVIGYGIGPMFLSPLSEIPQFGRTWVYIITVAIFALLQIPTALSKNLGALLPLRFLAGLIGSPVLATGGASLVDMYSDEWRAVTIGLWGLAGVCGPVLGPIVGGFAAQAKGWTWTIWILLWLSGFTTIFITFFQPETSSQAILYRRAVRLRRLTGDPRFKSQGELDGANMTLGDVAQMTLIRPFIFGFTEPIVVVWNVYIALAYGVLYIFISSVDVVFIEHHHFNLGQNGLAFLGAIVGAILSYAVFLVWAIRVLKPMIADGTRFTPEERLPPAMIGGIFLPISLFLFGWTAPASVPYIFPMIGMAFFSSAIFLLLQAGLNYLPDSYPRHVASVLAANGFFRSIVGAAFPLFSRQFFHNLGVGPASSILGGISILMIPIPYVLYRYGARIRSWSKFAD